MKYYLTQLFAVLFLIGSGCWGRTALDQYREGNPWDLACSLISLSVGIWMTLASTHDALNRMKRALKLRETHRDRCSNMEDDLRHKLDIINKHVARLVEVGLDMKNMRVGSLSTSGWRQIRREIVGSAVDLIMADCAMSWPVQKEEFRDVLHEAVIARIERGAIEIGKGRKSRFINWTLQPVEVHPPPST